MYTRYGFKEVGEDSHCDLRPYRADVVFRDCTYGKSPSRLEWQEVRNRQKDVRFLCRKEGQSYKADIEDVE